MKSYLALLWTQTRKNHFLLAAFGFLFVMTLGFWLLNTTNQNSPFLQQSELDRPQLEEALAVVQAEKGDAQAINAGLTRLDAAKQAYLKHDYQQAYRLTLKNYQAFPQLKANLTAPDEKIQLWHALAAADLPEVDLAHANNTILFSYRFLETVFPVLVVLVSAYVFGLIFRSSYAAKLNLDGLLPQRYWQILLEKLCFSTIIVLFGVALILGIVDLIAALFAGFGHTNYPISAYQAGQPALTNVATILGKSIVLAGLIIPAIAITSFVLQQVTGNYLLTFFLTFFVFVGQAYLVTILKSFKTIVHLLPGFYLQVVGIATGSLAVTLGNAQITYQMGIKVISCYLVVMVGVMLLIGQLRQARRH